MKLDLGMSPAAVTEIFGGPRTTRIDPGGETVWAYRYDGDRMSGRPIVVTVVFADDRVSAVYTQGR